MKSTKTRHATKSEKARRRTRRDAGHGGPDDRWHLRSLSGPVDPIVLRRTIDAFSSFDLEGSWETIAPRVLPLLKRVRHPFPPDAAPIHLRIPPGVEAGFGIDVGPAWAHVTRALVDRWGVDAATLLGTALDNLRRRALEEPPRVEESSIEGSRITVIQAQGWGSALVLAPDRLASAIGSAPRLLLTPVRNAVVALPEDVPVDLAVAVWEAFADGSADELDVGPLRWTGSTVDDFLPDAAEPPLVH